MRALGALRFALCATLVSTTALVVAPQTASATAPCKVAAARPSHFGPTPGGALRLKATFSCSAQHPVAHFTVTLQRQQGSRWVKAARVPGIYGPVRAGHTYVLASGTLCRSTGTYRTRAVLAVGTSTLRATSAPGHFACSQIPLTCTVSVQSPAPVNGPVSSGAITCNQPVPGGPSAYLALQIPGGPLGWYETVTAGCGGSGCPPPNHSGASYVYSFTTQPYACGSMSEQARTFFDVSIPAGQVTKISPTVTIC